MQQRAIQTRERILQTALREFSAKGLHGARVDRIAAGAGANKERLYAYFGGKQKLFREVLKQCLGEIAVEEEILLSQVGGDASRLQEAVLRHYMGFHERHPHFWRLLAWENLEGGEHSRILRDIRGETLERLRRLYQSGQRKGVFKKGVSFETFIFALSALSFFYFSNQRTMSQTLALDLRRPRVRERLIAEALRLLKHYGRADGRRAEPR